MIDRWWRQASLVALLILSMGCDGTTERNLPKGKVAGKVTYNGQPLPEGTISFQHVSGELASAPIGSDGAYTIEVAEGDNQVSVQSREPQQPNPDPNGMPRVLPGKSRIPDKFAAFSASGLKYTVKAGDNSYDVPLKD